VLSVLSMFTFRKQIYGRLRRTLPAMKSGPAGEVITMPAALEPGATCRLEFRGSSWDVVNGGKFVIAAGSPARIVSVERLTLVVHGDG
jgi:hypothetical protein